MPNINPGYTNTTALQPTETGIESLVRSGRIINQNYNEAAAATDQEGQRLAGAVRDAGNVAVDFAQHQEISHGAAQLATTTDALTQAWNNTAKTADPNDPTVAQKFREETLEPVLQKFGQGFLTEGGQKWAESRVDALRQHMFQKTAADMGTLAADAVSVNVKTMANTMSNTAMLDPSSVPHLLEGIDSSIGAMVDSSPNLKGVAAAGAKTKLSESMREAIVKAGAIGAIQKSPDPEAEAEKWGRLYPQYINGAELKMLGANARQQIRAGRIDQAYSEHIQKQFEQEASDKAETHYVQKLYSDNPQDIMGVSTKAIANDQNLNRVAKERLITIVNREIKPETDAKISAQTSTQIFRAMRDPNADPQKITQMIFDARSKEPGEAGSLTKGDFNDLQKNLIDLKTPDGMARTSERSEFFKRYAGTIDGTLAETGLHSALGEQQMYLAEKALRAEEARLGPDWRKLYDPNSPDFFGRPSNIMKYHVSYDQSAAFIAQQKAAEKSQLNLTSPGKTITGISVEDKPPMPGAQKAPDGNWYIEKNGKYFRVKQ